MTCLDCLSDEKTLIPAPICQDECDNTPQCEDELDANCITVTPALPCINTAANTALTIILQAIDAKLCQSVSNLNTCKVRVSATDECCDFLNTKVSVSNGLTKSIVKSGNCETLTISHPTWNSLNFTAPLLSPAFTLGLIGLNIPKAHTYFTGNQRVHEVKLTGLISFNLGSLSLNFKNNLTKLTSLPLGIPAPKEDYYCSYSKILPGGNIMVAEIVIGGQSTLSFETGGVYVQIFSSISEFFQSYFPLDGINYHI